jgi:pyruvate formate lyase activating enzyme
MRLETNNQNTIEKGYVFEIERYAIKDGPGIRTVVFLKGCPLRCKWCANPESQKEKRELAYWHNKCIGCGRCLNKCQQSALNLGEQGIKIDREKCVSCGECCEVCNTEALVMIGNEKTADEILKEIQKDQMFYDESGGGVTFSGGEPLSQPALLKQTAMLCKQHEIHTCVETCGFAKWEDIENVMPYIDVFLFDLKHMDANKHKKMIGVSNETILRNFEKLIANDKKVIVRIPIITTYNDDETSVNAFIDYLKDIAPSSRVDLLPYHRLGLSKYKSINVDYELRGLLPPSEQKMKEIKDKFATNGFNVSIGG